VVSHDDFRFHCDDCPRSYRWKHHLKRHRLQAHRSDDVVPTTDGELSGDAFNMVIDNTEATSEG
jgi:hypothetical protein